MILENCNIYFEDMSALFIQEGSVIDSCSLIGLGSGRTSIHIQTDSIVKNTVMKNLNGRRYGEAYSEYGIYWENKGNIRNSRIENCNAYLRNVKEVYGLSFVNDTCLTINHDSHGETISLYKTNIDGSMRTVKTGVVFNYYDSYINVPIPGSGTVPINLYNSELILSDWITGTYGIASDSIWDNSTIRFRGTIPQHWRLQGITLSNNSKIILDKYSDAKPLIIKEGLREGIDYTVEYKGEETLP